MIEVIAIVVTIALATIPYLWKKYTSRPENTIEINFTGGQKRTQGLSPRNEAGASSYAQNLIHVYHLQWNFNVVIRNNSDIDSYYTELVLNAKS